MDIEAKFTRLLAALVKRPKSKAKRKAFFRFWDNEIIDWFWEREEGDWDVLFKGILVLFQKIKPITHTEYSVFNLFIRMLCVYSIQNVNATLALMRTRLLETTFDVFLNIPTQFREPLTVDIVYFCVTLLLEEPRTKNRLKEYHRYEEVVSEAATSKNEIDLMKYREKFCRTADCGACGASETEPLEFKKCGGCKLVVYCSENCQKQDWENHAKFCKKLHLKL